MIVDVQPRRLEVTPGSIQYIEVTLSNPGEIIGGYQLRILGADPGWIEGEEEPFSLFPEETKTLRLKVTVPHGLPAGDRNIAVQVRELTPPEENTILGVVLVVPADPSVNLRVDPLVQQGGRKARWSILLDNNGNTVVEGRLAATDPEGEGVYLFDPPDIRLNPGEHAVVDLTVKAKQPRIGNPMVRTFSLYLDDPATQTALAEQSRLAAEQVHGTRTPEEQAEVERLHLTLPGRKPTPAPLPAPERETPPLALATFVQRALVGRGAISLFGLLAAISVFALVITLALSKIVSQSAADRDLALQVAQADQNGATTGSSSLSGTVRLLTSGTPVPGVAVTLYTDADTTTPFATTATKADGTYAIANLPAGKYKLTYRGAGFIQLWYPAALDASDASTVELDSNNQHGGLDVSLGGVPATLTGTVTGGDVGGATLTLLTPSKAQVASNSTSGDGSTADTAALQAFGQPERALALAPDTTTTVNAADGGAIVKTVPLGSDGTFQIDNVPSPSVYVLQVTKQGYATSTQLINVSAGETRDGLTIELRQGDGVIAGQVNSTSAPLGGVSITATVGQSTVTTVSLDHADSDSPVGSFTLRNLPTPGQITIVARADGYASQTISVSLSAGQQLSGLAFIMSTTSGALSGQVSITNGDSPVGVLATITDGSTTITAATDTSGAWSANGIPVPGTYTVTLARSDLAAYSAIVELDSAGEITANSQGAGVSASGITATLHSATGAVEGTLKDQSGTGLGEYSVTASCIDSGNCGSSTYCVTTASDPSGAYRLEGLRPGRYSLAVSSSPCGTANPTNLIPDGTTITAGASITKDWQLSNSGTISVSLTLAGSPAPAGLWVALNPYNDTSGTYGAKIGPTQWLGSPLAFAGLSSGYYQITVSTDQAGASIKTTRLAFLDVNATVPVTIAVLP